MPYNKHAVRQASHLRWSGYTDDFASPDVVQIHLYQVVESNSDKSIFQNSERPHADITKYEKTKNEKMSTCSIQLAKNFKTIV